MSSPWPWRVQVFIGSLPTRFWRHKGWKCCWWIRGNWRVSQDGIRKQIPAIGEWIQRLNSCGLLRGSFRPQEAICMLRTLVRDGEPGGGVWGLAAEDAEEPGPDERARGPGRFR